MLFRYLKHGEPIPHGWELANKMDGTHHGWHGVLIKECEMVTRVLPKSQSKVDLKTVRDYVNESISGYGECSKITLSSDETLLLWINWNGGKTKVLEVEINVDHGKRALNWAIGYGICKRGS